VGVAVFSPQLTHLVGPGFNTNPGGGVYQAFSDFQQSPIFAVLREWPNGSWSAQVWVYNPNTLPMHGGIHQPDTARELVSVMVGDNGLSGHARDR